MSTEESAQEGANWDPVAGGYSRDASAYYPPRIPERPIAAEAVEIMWRYDRHSKPRPFTMWGLVAAMLTTAAIISMINAVVLIILYENYLHHLAKL